MVQTFTFIFLQCLIASSSFVARQKAGIPYVSLAARRAAADPATSSPDSSSSPRTSSFDWEHQWYPVIPIRDLETDRPNKVTLLGRDFCVWSSLTADGTTIQTQVFADVCPHRLVPLSAGRIENNLLQCAYHGWEFNDKGFCVRIPQLGSQESSQSPPLSAAVTSPRACATSFPVRIEQDLLWIFPSTTNQELAAIRQPALMGQLEDSRNVDATDLYTRDLPYPWEILVENLCDPSHISFAHHEIINGANRYDDDQQINLKITEENENGFVANKENVPAAEYEVRFEAPCFLYYSISRNTTKGDSYFGIGNYCIPTAPGKCRLIARFPFRIPVAPAMFALKHTPTWITHYAQNAVLDSDVVFLTSQHERVKHAEVSTLNADNVPSRYYMPSKADTLVRTFRKWLVSAGGPVWLGTPVTPSGGDSTSWIRVPERSGRDALLDRYRQHTEICASCRTTHRNLYRLREVFKYASFGLLAWSSVSRQKAVAMAAIMLFAVPRLILRPLIVRLECVPWPRKRWLLSSSATKKGNRNRQLD